MVRVKAKLFAKEMDLQDFIGNPTWLYRFVCRHDLVLHQRTQLGQRFPDEFEDKILAFQRNVIQMRQANNYPLEQIGNMNETPMQFDMPPNKGDKRPST